MFKKYSYSSGGILDIGALNRLMFTKHALYLRMFMSGSSAEPCFLKEIDFHTLTPINTDADIGFVPWGTGATSNRLYQADFTTSSVHEYDMDTLTIINTKAHGAGNNVFGIDGTFGGRLFARSYRGFGYAYGSFLELDPDTLLVLDSDGTISSQLYRSCGVADDRMFCHDVVLTQTGDNAMEVDIETLLVINTAKIVPTFGGKTVAPVTDLMAHNGSCYMINRSNNDVFKVDMDTLAITEYIGTVAGGDTYSQGHCLTKMP